MGIPGSSGFSGCPEGFEFVSTVDPGLGSILAAVHDCFHVSTAKRNFFDANRECLDKGACACVRASLRVGV